MKLLELTPAERVFLDGRAMGDRGFVRRLTGRLATVLSARLRMPIVLQPDLPPADGEPVKLPTWCPDAALASLWLTRRLGGGRRVMGTVRYVPRTLIDMLDQQLAECWIEGSTEPDDAAGARAWTLDCAGGEARLVLYVPDQSFDRARWARGVIERG